MTLTQAGVRFWCEEATDTALQIRDRWRLKIRGIRDLELVGRVLEPQRHRSLGGEGFAPPRGLSVDALAGWLRGQQEQCRPEAWACVLREARTADAWRWVMRDRGLRVDVERLDTLLADISAESARSMADLGVDVTRSGAEVTQWLRRHAISTPGGLGADAWDKAVMPDSSRPAWERFMAAHELAADAGKASELRGQAVGGRIYPTLDVMSAVTGRQSASRPAVQNLNPAMRSCLLADEGFTLVGGDFAHAEPSLAALMSGDEAMLAAMEGDPYVELARAIWPGDEVTSERRKLAKTSLIALLYGQGVESSASALHVSPDEVRAIREGIGRAWPAFAAWKRALDQGADQGRLVSAFGRPIPEPVAGKEYARINYVVQGTGKDLLTTATVRVLDSPSLGAKSLFLPVHDELVVMVPTGEAEAARDALQEAMTVRSKSGFTLRASVDVLGSKLTHA